MVFNSYLFAFFFVVVFVCYQLNYQWRLKKLFLLIMSWLFYAAWNLPYLLIIIFSTIVDFYAAKKIYRADSQKGKRFWLFVSLTANLGVLSYFKYGEFLLVNTTNLLAQFGIIYEPMPWSVLLPIGISFYTFQTLTYSLDVFKGRMRPDAGFLDFAVFVAFFPQLVAGPIVRARRFLPQLKVQPKVSADQLGWALVLFLIGLFEKVVLADGLFAPVVDSVYEHDEILPASTVILANFAFMGQIFADFSGYSLMAIGVALSLGFVLPVNFRAPFSAIGYADFWQRWHISMSSWFRDYLYASIKSKRSRSIYNIMYAQLLTMTIIGLWHGASWTFVFWGAFNGFVLMTELWLRYKIGHWPVWHTTLAQILFWALTMLLLSQSAVLFRAEDLSQTGLMLTSLFNIQDSNFDVPMLNTALVLICLTGLFLAHWQLRHRPLREVVDAMPLSVVTVLGALAVFSIAVIGSSADEFIYFQF
ncbi:MBOAT family O-acyltransferase [Ruegeria sp.]|uniref:MBOAT family O-acyltransferase n=1 Tax=Ruegeria sp. TaxID=1879320 RepID=UPI003C7EB961